MIAALVLLGSWHVLPAEILDMPAQHTRHAAVFSKGVPEFNKLVLKGVDAAQSNAMLGGGYFIGIKAEPTESPVGYPLCLLGKSLLDPPRPTSFCTGASYAAFIEALNLWMPSQSQTLGPHRVEALRMQEPDGGRREDGVKFWGHWNADGFGNHFALVQYSQMGERIKPIDARPGDFLNISWKSGIGHSTVFLGWCLNREGEKAVRFWSSQQGTNGMGDQVSSLDTIRSVCVVRVNRPWRIYSYNPGQTVDKKIVGDSVDW
jgi:hypothetical protein